MISEEAIKILKANYNNYSETLKEVVNKAIETVEKDMAIKALEQPEQKKGKWVKNEDGTWSCSLCHSWISYDQHYYARYCLYCGAKMEEEE